MNRSVDLKVAQATLSELVAGLMPNDEVVILQNDKPVAKLVGASLPRKPRVPGLMKGKLTVLVEDNEHLDSFGVCLP